MWSAQEDTNWLCSQAMRPQARCLPMPRPEPTWRNERCRNGNSRSEAKPSGASESLLLFICYSSVISYCVKGIQLADNDAVEKEVTGNLSVEQFKSRLTETDKKILEMRMQGYNL